MYASLFNYVTEIFPSEISIICLLGQLEWEPLDPDFDVISIGKQIMIK